MNENVVSLFAGAGGCSLGFTEAGFDVHLAVDIDGDAIRTYQQNFPETLSREKDIIEINSSWIAEQIGNKTSSVDFLIGGPPCQGFSSAGGKFWDDPRNELLKHYTRLLDELKPKWFLMENVEGLLTAQDSSYVHEAAKRFINAGYTIRIHKLYSHWYGLPQKRKRVFIVGNSAGINFEFPEPTHRGISARGPPRSIMDAISDLPAAATNNSKPLAYSNPPQNKYQESLRGQSVVEHSTSKLSETLSNRISYLDPGQSMQDLPEELQHNSFEERAYRRVKDGTPTEKRGGPPSGLKRLDPDEPSLTITTGSDSEFIHPVENRFLTFRECARIQSFPDSFQFKGSKTAKQQQVANAIPPLIAEKLAVHFREMIIENRGEKYDNSEGELLGFYLTKANSRSPALDRTYQKLSQLRHQSEARI